MRRLTRGLRLAGRVGRLLWPHARGGGGALALGGLLSVLVLGLRLAQPWPLKWIVDALPDVASLGLLCAGYVVLSAGAALAEYGQRLALAGLGSRIVHAFRARLFAHLLALPLTFHERRAPGELLTRVVSDTSRLRRGVIGFLLRIGQTLLLFVATVAVLVWIDPLLSAIVLGCGLLALAAMLAGNRRILSASRRARKREGVLAGVVDENLRGVRELQTFRAPVDPRFDEQSRKSLKGELKVQRLESGMLLRVEMLMAAAVCLILLLGSVRLSAGALVLFVTYALALYRPFAQFARQASQGGRTAACAERLIRIVERRPPADGTLARTLAGEIVFENVGVRASRRARGGRKRVLEGVSFRILPGERVAIVGPNGAGKSTLLRLVARLHDPREGRVLIDGRDAREYALDSLRGQMSAVGQEPALFGLTLRQNVALGRPGATDEEVAVAARRSDVANLVVRLPHGYDTVVRGGRLFSSGERHRLALARALVRNGPIWLLDEPTTAVDAPEEMERALLEATRGRTTLWVTHDLAMALRMDRILAMENGRVRFFGPPAEFQAEALCRR